MKINAQSTAIPLMVLLLAAAPGQTYGQAAATPPAAPVSSTEQAIRDLKNPTPWLSWGADFRARNEYLNNTLTLSPQNSLHEQDYFRFRARLWASVTPVEDLSLNARIATEPREWMKPAGYTPMRGQSGWDWSEGIIDNLNVKWKNALDQPLNVTVGRQDIMLGDGWLMGDGTPFDGSWTYFFDAARVSYELKDANTVIEAIGIIQEAEDDAWLPPIPAEKERFFTEQNERGAILTIANSSIKEANITGFFFYKKDKVSSIPITSRPDNADIYTFGLRVNGLLGENVKYWVEGAYQLGEKQDYAFGPSAVFKDIQAFGLNSRATYLFKDKMNNQLTLAYEFLSGDDPSTDEDEMFDVLWGRWPRWSEIGLYSYAAEHRIGQQANLHRIGPTWNITPLKNLDFAASYYALFSDQQAATRGAPGLFSNDGTFRGHFVQAVLKYKFNQHMNAHLWAEQLYRGDFYTSSHALTFLRGEIFFTF